ncbi:uncharacterized protein [Bemisia tabaci]|uniref:uncharacterized protein isoform X2 n=1 Tax=Bemisia tabaci TaxID=7038 RepID=UPI0008F9C579|nr:PREDICTED: uncharacterized protein LOC109033100 [Bemisia tabaci]
MEVFSQNRQKKLFNRAFLPYITALHFVTTASATIMTFGAINEIRSNGKVTMNALNNMSYCGTSFGSWLALSYCANRLQEAHDRLRYSLWESDWTLGGREFKQNFLNCETLLCYRMPLKAYKFYQINLHSFTRNFYNVWSVIAFLYQVSGKQLRRNSTA